MDDPAEPFRDHVEVHEYAERNGLDYAWAGTALFEKRKRTLPPDQFQMREVRTRKGRTTVGLFSKAIARADGKRTCRTGSDWRRCGSPGWRGSSGVQRARRRGAKGEAEITGSAARSGRRETSPRAARRLRAS